MEVKHAWLLKNKPNNYDSVSYTYVYSNGTPIEYTMYEKAVKIASNWRGINGEKLQR